MHKKCRGFILGLWFMLQNNIVSVCEKRTLCDFMHRHLHIFQGVKSFWRFTYLCEQTPYHSHTARHHFSFLWYFFLSGVELWKVIIFSSYFYSAFELFWTDVLSTPNPGQTIYLNLPAIFLYLEHQKNKSNIIEMGMCFKVIGSRRGFTTIENCVK